MSNDKWTEHNCQDCTIKNDHAKWKFKNIRQIILYFPFFLHFALQKQHERVYRHKKNTSHYAHLYWENENYFFNLSIFHLNRSISVTHVTSQLMNNQMFSRKSMQNEMECDLLLRKCYCIWILNNSNDVAHIKIGSLNCNAITNDHRRPSAIIQHFEQQIIGTS